MPALANIKDRQSLQRTMASAFNRREKEILEELEYEAGHNQPKTYLVEFHKGQERTLMDAIKHLASIGFEHKDYPSERLIYLRHHSKREYTDFILDYFDERFTFLHTVDSREDTLPAVRRLVEHGGSFDFAWFPAKMMENVADSSDIVTFWHSSFKPKAKSLLEDTNEIGSTVMQLTGRHSWPNYRKLQSYVDDAGAKWKIPVDTLRIMNGNRTYGGYAKIHLTNLGYFTGRGDSYELYLSFIRDIRRAYRRDVETIEKKFSVFVEPEEFGLKQHGEPFVIQFAERRDDVQAFIRDIFSCNQPFKLGGVVDPLADDYFRVFAEDLHVGARMTFEINPEFMRIYLQPGSCGNSILRFITNMQQVFDPHIKTSTYS